MSNLDISYNKILGLLHELEPQDNFLNQIRIPKLSDKQLIALALTAESSSIDSERHLFKQLPTTVIGQIDRSVFNRRHLGRHSPCHKATFLRMEIEMPNLGRFQVAEVAYYFSYFAQVFGGI